MANRDEKPYLLLIAHILASPQYVKESKRYNDDGAQKNTIGIGFILDAFSFTSLTTFASSWCFNLSTTHNNN